METRWNALSRRTCQCSKSTLPSTSSLLFLLLSLPRTTYAQLLHRQEATSIPSTLLTTSTSNPTPTTTSPPSTVQTNPPATATTDPSSSHEHVFSYYFLIVVVVAILICILLLYFSQRRKRKAALQRSTSQRALAQDVAGFRARGPTRQNLFRHWNAAGQREERIEGLDERGEAPPPYVPGSGDVELRRLSEEVGRGEGEGEGEGQKPPEYGHVVEEDIGDIARPRAAVTVPERH